MSEEFVKRCQCLAPAKAACAWPDCDCDPYATEVIRHLVDQGWQPPKEEE